MSAETDGLWAEIRRLRAEADELRQARAKVWIYTDRRGPEDALIVFADEDTANAWFRENDPEGVAFEHPVVSSPSAQVDRPRSEAS